MKLFWFGLYLFVIAFFAVIVMQNNLGITEVTTYSGPQVLAASDSRYAASGDDFIDAINQTRTQNGVGRLTVSERLNQVSDVRLNDMISHDYYSHFSPDGTKFSDLLSSPAGYSCENLNLSSQSDPILSISDWLGSNKGHRECLLNPELNFVGYDFGAYDLQTSSYITVLVMSSN